MNTNKINNNNIQNIKDESLNKKTLRRTTRLLHITPFRDSQIQSPNQKQASTDSKNQNEKKSSVTAEIDHGPCGASTLSSWRSESSNISLVVLDNVLYYPRNFSF